MRVVHAEHQRSTGCGPRNPFVSYIAGRSEYNKKKEIALKIQSPTVGNWVVLGAGQIGPKDEDSDVKESRVRPYLLQPRPRNGFTYALNTQKTTK